MPKYSREMPGGRDIRHALPYAWQDSLLAQTWPLDLVYLFVPQVGAVGVSRHCFDNIGRLQ